MSHNIWHRWVTHLFQQKSNKRFRNRIRARRRLTLEGLEDRLVPATFIWTGLGTGPTAADWSNANNWSGGVTPVAGADIVFSSTTTTNTQTFDDISLATGMGFDSISFSASGYSIASSATNKLVITGALNANANLGITPATGEPTITALLELASPASNPQQTITVGSDTVLDISGTVSGNSAAQTVFKAGVGELELDGNNTGYTGAVNLAANGGIVLITNNDALGTGAAVSGDPNAGVTTVNSNAQLQLRGNLNVPEQLILNGPGFVNDGAILNVSGNNTWSGQVQMDSNSSFGSNSGDLTFSNTVSDLGAGDTVTKVGYGTVTFATADTYRGQTIINNGILMIENPLSLGAGADSTTIQSGTPGSETIVNYNGPAQTFGTLEINYIPGTISGTDPNAILQNPGLPFNATTNPVVGFQVFNDILVLNAQWYTNAWARAESFGRDIQCQRQ
jgi:autotransporter-associated beta strand protein